MKTCFFALLLFSAAAFAQQRETGKTVTIRGTVMLVRGGHNALITGSPLTMSEGLDPKHVSRMTLEGSGGYVPSDSAIHLVDCDDATVTETADEGNFLDRPDRTESYNEPRIVSFRCDDAKSIDFQLVCESSGVTIRIAGTKSKVTEFAIRWITYNGMKADLNDLGRSPFTAPNRLVFPVKDQRVEMDFPDSLENTIGSNKITAARLSHIDDSSQMRCSE